MHEYSLVRALIERAEREARRHPGASVAVLRLAVGRQAGVEAELLRAAFEIARPRTLCSRATLEIRGVDPEWRCANCGRDLAPGARLRCPACGAPGRLVAGGDIVLEQLELEVPDGAAAAPATGAREIA